MRIPKLPSELQPGNKFYMSTKKVVFEVLEIKKEGTFFRAKVYNVNGRNEKTITKDIQVVHVIPV